MPRSNKRKYNFKGSPHNRKRAQTNTDSDEEKQEEQPSFFEEFTQAQAQAQALQTQLDQLKMKQHVLKEHLVRFIVVVFGLFVIQFVVRLKSWSTISHILHKIITCHIPHNTQYINSTSSTG